MPLDEPIDEYEQHYLNVHADTADEPYVASIHELALHGLDRVGHHGPVAAMGVERSTLPSWDSACCSRPHSWRGSRCSMTKTVGTDVVIGGNAGRTVAARHFRCS